MASLKMNIPHRLEQQEALHRIKGLLGKLRQEQKDEISNLREDWNGNTGKFKFTARGFDISGVIDVNAGGVDIDANVPFAVALFKGRIKQVIDTKARELLS
jgi:hypothetical protein